MEVRIRAWHHACAGPGNACVVLPAGGVARGVCVALKVDPPRQLVSAGGGAVGAGHLVYSRAGSSQAEGEARGCRPRQAGCHNHRHRVPQGALAACKEKIKKDLVL